MINEFFNKWEFLTNNPYSTIHRMDLVDASQKMIESFQDLYRSIEFKIDDVKFQMRTAVDRMNQISDDLAHILNSISMNEAMGTPINDLLDKYDLLLDELSSYGNVSVQERENGTKSVYFGTVELVRNSEARHLQIEDRVNSMTGEAEYFISWDDIKNDVNGISGLTTGSLRAMYDLKDVILPGYLQKLDNMAVQIVKSVNDIHKKGYNITDPPATGAFFFAPKVTGVMDFSLSKEVLSDPAFIAASLTGATGDNQIALMITDLRQAQIFDGQTLTEHFADFVYEIGNDVKMSKQSSERSTMLSQQSDNFRESVKGVSINEETANLMQYQQAYQAAARIISVADEMFKTIIALVR
jgi:flagellar hook-associated protein 1 FlgK